MLAASLFASLLSLPLTPFVQPEVLTGFRTVLVSHINATVGSDNLPSVMGLPLEPGMFVSVSSADVTVFDERLALIQNGLLADQTAAGECKTHCAASLFYGFQAKWLELAIESQGLRSQLPARVLFAVDRNTPTTTLAQVAYAAAETRPSGPPLLGLLVNGGRAGLRTLPIHLIPPEGLSLPAGSNALGLQVRFTGSGYTVTAADPRFSRRVKVGNPQDLISALMDIKKNYPSKDTVIFHAHDGLSVDGMLQISSRLRGQFPNLVLAIGQEIRVR